MIVAKKARRMKRRERREWKTNEIKYLMDHYGKMPANLIASKLNRHPQSVWSKANGLGLKGYKKVYALYRGDEILAIGTIEEIAKQTGLKRETVRKYGTPSERKKVDAQLIEIKEWEQ